MSDSPKPEFISARTIWDPEDIRELMYIRVAYRIGDDTYLGKSNVITYRPTAKNIKLDELKDVFLIPKAHIRPLYSEDFSLAPDPLPEGTFIMEPDYCAYDPEKPEILRDLIKAEAWSNEVRMCNPHPNIAQYYGCQIKDGRITGLCFEKYETLSSRVNPGYANKILFDAEIRPLKDLTLFLQGIKDGVEHLHSQGVAHNNLNPLTVGFRADDTPIVIDLKMCQRFNTPMHPDRQNRWRGWADETNTVSLATNDTDVIEELERWLTNNKNYTMGPGY